MAEIEVVELTDPGSVSVVEVTPAGVSALDISIPENAITVVEVGIPGVQGPAGTGSGTTDFLGLSDTPNAYSGEALKVVRVNAGETGLEFSSSDRAIRVFTAAGDTDVDPADDIIIIKKSVSQSTIVLLDAAANRTTPVTIKDGNGDCDDFPITVTPDGSETIDGASDYVLRAEFQSVTLYPYPDGSGWFIT